MSVEPTDPSGYEEALPSAPGGVASFDEDRGGPVRRLQRFLHAFPTAIPLIVLIAGVTFFSVLVPGRFFSPLNFSLVLQQVTVIAMLGIAQTLVILTAGIDLSVGVIMVMCSVMMGRTAVVYGVPVEIAFPLGILAGLACGAVNGLIVTMLRLPPFIVTLGTWSIFGALNVLYSHSESVRQQEIEAAAPFLQWTAGVIKPFDIASSVLHMDVLWLKGWVLTYGSILMVVVALIVAYILNKTAFGRHVYAAGDDPDAARLAGISVTRTIVGVYTLGGLICGIAGWVLIGRVGGVSPLGGQTANLDSITAVVIGGTSLFGGRGSIAGTLVGALIVGVFRNGLALSGLDVLWQDFTVGVLIIAAVTVDQWIRRLAS